MPSEERKSITIIYTGEVCSINKRYRNRRFTLTDDYRCCKLELYLSAKIQYKGEPLEGKIGLSIRWEKGRKDIDSGIKVILDSMQKVLYINDKQIDTLFVSNKKGKTEITVWEL